MPPSEDLADEVEAINSIYGAGTLVLDDAGGDAGDGSGGSGGSGGSENGSENGTLAVLAVPASAEDVGDDDESSRLCLSLYFPPRYPASPSSQPPAVLGVQSVGRGDHRRPGAAAHDAARFGAALAAAFAEGQVCVFDAIAAFHEGGGGGQPDVAGLAGPDAQPPEPEPEPGPPAHAFSPLQWTVGEPFVELRSTFVGRCARVASPAHAAAAIQQLKDGDRRIRDATHNMTAWRIQGRQAAPLPTAHHPQTPPSAATAFQDCDDDGETAAGGRLLHLMQLMDLWDVVVVVTRWYGGHKLGPRRFALINQAARDAVVKAGLVEEKKDKKR